MKFTSSLLIAAVSGLKADTSIIYRSDKTEADYTVSDEARADFSFFFPYPLNEKGQEEYSCGASLISENYAITAAHCFDGKAPKTFQATVGGAVRTIKDTRIHSCWADEATKTNRNGADIAILVF